MKSKILIVALFITCFSAQSQINQGRVMLGGDISYNNSKQESRYPSVLTPNLNKNSNYGSRLRYGVLITDHIMVGLSGTYNVTKQINEHNSSFMNRSTQTTKGSNYGGGLFVRYYQTIAGSKFAFFAQLAPSYTLYRSKTTSEHTDPNMTSTPATMKGSSFGVLINPGLTYFVNKTFALEMSFGGISYNSYKAKNYNNGVYSGDTESTNLGFNLLSSLSLGLNFYFGPVKDPAPEASK